jgi:hypothetical protein
VGTTSHDKGSLTTDLAEAGGFTGGENAAAVGFAGVLLIMVGLFYAVQGLVALLGDDLYVRGENYVFHFSFTTWGWIHLLLVIMALDVFVMWAAIVHGRALVEE